MDKPLGQSDRPEAPGRRGPASEATRVRLLAAAAELIAELGWGRVTTRAVAARAGLPHGSVSYHFRGKQELLTEAALHAFADAVPADAFERMTSLGDMLELIRAEVGRPDLIDTVLSRLLMETLREAERDPTLRERTGQMLQSYRAVTADLVRREQEHGVLAVNLPPEGLATLMAAVGDGLLMHALLDPSLDVGAALDALDILLSDTE